MPHPKITEILISSMLQNSSVTSEIKVLLDKVLDGIAEEKKSELSNDFNQILPNATDILSGEKMQKSETELPITPDLKSISKSLEIGQIPKELKFF